MNGVVGLLPIVAILLLFYLLLIRPQARRAREQQRMQSEIAIGDEVMLTSGFFGTVTELYDDRVEVEIAPEVLVTVVRAAIGRVVHDEDAEAYDEVDEDEYEYDDDESYEDEDDVVPDTEEPTMLRKRRSGTAESEEG